MRRAVRFEPVDPSCYSAAMTRPKRPASKKAPKKSVAARTVKAKRPTKASAKPPRTYAADAVRRLSGELARWKRTTVAKATTKSALRKEKFTTDSGIEIPDVLTLANRAQESVDQLGLPGEFPYTRGVQPTMYRGRLWTMRQFAGFGSPKDTNGRFKYLLERGTTGLSTAFDMPALMGYERTTP